MRQLVLFFIFLGVLVLAPPRSHSTPIPDCPHARTQLEMERCVTSLRDAEGEKLRIAFEGALRRVTGHSRALLQESQSAWERYRDAECSAAFDRYSDGSMATLELLACQRLLTSQRVDEIRRVYTD